MTRGERSLRTYVWLLRSGAALFGLGVIVFLTLAILSSSVRVIATGFTLLSAFLAIYSLRLATRLDRAESG